MDSDCWGVRQCYMSYKWKRQSTLRLNKCRWQGRYNRKHLRLYNVSSTRGGNYTCTATNSMGAASVTILVRITSTCKSQ